MTRDAILGQLRERIVAFAASRIGKEAAEDLAQDTLMVLEQRYPGVADITELLPLSFQIIRFKISAHVRKSVRRGEIHAVPVDELPLRDGAVPPDEAVEREETKLRLLTALSRMGERCRTLFRLKLSGSSFEQIRAAMGASSINTVYTWDLRCRQELKARMGLGAARENA